MALKSKGVIISGLSLAIIIGALKYKIDVLNDEKAELRDTIIKIEKNIENANKEINNLNNQIKDKDEQLKVLNKELKVTIEEYEKIKKENKELKNTNKKLNETSVSAKSTKTSTNYNVTQDEIDLLERLVYCEARGESEQGQIAIVNVIFNRLNDDEFPNTITDVIYQKNQFSPVSNGAIYNAKPDEKVKQSVQKALRGEKVISDESVYFFATWVRSNHPIRSHVNILQTIGVHHFGKWM